MSEVPAPPRADRGRHEKQRLQKERLEAYRARFPPSPPPTSNAERLARQVACLELYEARRKAHEKVWGDLEPDKSAIPQPRMQHAVLTAAEVRELEDLLVDVVSCPGLLSRTRSPCELW